MSAVCVECGVPRPFFGAMALDLNEAGEVVGVAPVCTVCCAKDKEPQGG
jgi:hypothetical protein